MKRSFVLLVAFMLLTDVVIGQNTKKADKAFSAMRYYEAIQEYSSLENNVTDPHVMNHIAFNIAESYRRMNQPEKAEPYYVKAIKGGFLLPDIHYGYGEVLLNLSKYDEAKKQFEIFQNNNPGNKLVESKIASCIYAKSHRMDNSKFILQPMETLNTQGSEFGIAYFNDNLIYASTGNPIQDNETGKTKEIKISPRTGLPYSKFYMSVGLNNMYYKGEPIVELNKGGNKNGGTFAYDPINSLGYYTRCTGSGQSEQCYIYFAEFKSGQWKEIDNLKIENRNEPIGHPFVTLNGNRIYFVSVMEGGYGKSDIWYTDKLPGGLWSKPINLGHNINTAGSEMFPFVAGNYLFFSSDGHPGYGGLDIFASKIDGNVHGPAINLGMPFNSSYDDMNLIIKFDFTEGMLVSSRRPDRNDDIFKFEGFPSALTVSGKIYDSINNKPIPEVFIDIKKNGKLVEKLTSDETGSYVFFIDPDSSAYELSASVNRYAPISRTYISSKEHFSAMHNWNLPLKGNEAFISGYVTGVEESYDKSTVISLGPINGAKIVVFENDQAIELLETDEKGFYRFGDVKENTKYKVQVTVGNGDSFFSDYKELEVGDIVQNTEFCKENGYDMNVALIKIAKKIHLRNILYAYNKYDLLPASYVELDKLMTLLQKNPTLKIQISSHTDSKGSAKANQTLSEKRAASVVDYLVAKGISPLRLSSKGYGKSQLLVKPERSEADYQKNRRTEFTVIGTTGEPLYDTRLTVHRDHSHGEYNPQNAPQQQTQAQTQQPVTQSPATSSSSNAQSKPYTIQLAGTTKPASMSSSDFIKIKQMFNIDVYEVFTNGIYRYYAGGFDSVAEAKSVCDKINSALGKSGDAKFFVKKK